MRVCVLGIDSGGSKCDALVTELDGTAIGWGHCGVGSRGCGVAWGGTGRSLKTVHQAVRAAVEGLACDELHVTALGDSVPLGFWGAANVRRMILHPAAEAGPAFLLVGESCGVVALAGTGAFVNARTRAGRTLHLDGLGPLLGDYGGGYHIGTLAIRAAAKAHWNPRHATVLAETVPAMILKEGLGDPEGAGGLVEFMLGHPDRGEVAALARLVDDAARAGDAIAGGILREAADGLASTLRDVVEALDMSGEDCALIGTGSVIRNSDLYWDRFCARAASFAPRLRPLRPRVPAVAGLALSGLQELGVTIDGPLRDRLIETTRNLVADPRRPGAGPEKGAP